MIFLDVCGAILVMLVYGIYREVRDVAKHARARYKVEGLSRF